VLAEIRNISRATLKIVPKMSPTLDNSSAHISIGRPSKVFIIIGCPTRKHQIHANSIVCREAKDFTIDTKQKSLTERDVMISLSMSVWMDSVRYGHDFKIPLLHINAICTFLIII
jgi:hypothetical protein